MVLQAMRWRCVTCYLSRRASCNVICLKSSSCRVRTSACRNVRTRRAGWRTNTYSFTVSGTDCSNHAQFARRRLIYVSGYRNRSIPEDESFVRRMTTLPVFIRVDLIDVGLCSVLSGNGCINEALCSRDIHVERSNTHLYERLSPWFRPGYSGRISENDDRPSTKYIHSHHRTADTQVDGAGTATSEELNRSGSASSFSTLDTKSS